MLLSAGISGKGYYTAGAAFLHGGNMKHFLGQAGRLLLWQLISEILCLILAFSFAILDASFPLRIAGIVCCVTAHLLLTGNAAAKCADADLRLLRTSGIRRRILHPVLLGICTILPAYLLCGMLLAQRGSILMQNVYLLLNAPFSGINRLLFGAYEPFSAVPRSRQIMSSLLPLLTFPAVVLPYRLRYVRGTARTSRT